jgi:hypothetical protein
MNYGKIGNQDKNFYIEELTFGRTFIYNDKFYVLTPDFKSDGKRLAVSLTTGSYEWLKGGTIVKTQSIYYLDDDNNLLPIELKSGENNDANT